MNLVQSSDFDPLEQHIKVERDKYDAHLAFEKQPRKFMEKFGRKIITDMCFDANGHLCETPFGRKLDIHAGIDCFTAKDNMPDFTYPEVSERFKNRFKINEYDIKALALRGRFEDRDTFTVRVEKASGYDTELHKLIERVRNNELLRPDLTLQFCMPGGKLSSIAVIKTDDLVNYIDRTIGDRYKTQPGEWDKYGREKWEFVKGRTDTDFLSVSWYGLRQAGVPMTVYRFPTGDIDNWRIE